MLSQIFRMSKEELEMEFFGYKTCENYLYSNKDYSEFLQKIDSIELQKHIPYIKKMMVFRLKSIVEKKFRLMFNSLNLEVKQMNERDFGIYIWNSNYERLEKKSKNMSVFKVPTYYDDISGCFYNFSSFNLNIPILINKISVSKENSEIIYVHEICHPLLNRNKGIIENYMHIEFVSIFVELLYSYINHNSNVLYEDILMRFENIKKSIYLSLGKSQIERDSYIVSTLLAIDAFLKYIKFSDVLKLEMLKDLENVLNGNLILEDYLKKYEIHFNKKATDKLLIKTIEYANKR